MTKKEYVTEILSDILVDWNIPQKELQNCAKDIVDGLDVWYEMSSDSVARSNRYGELERQIETIKKDKQNALDKQEKEYQDKLKDANASIRAIIYQKNQKIEELQKQIK